MHETLAAAEKLMLSDAAFDAVPPSRWSDAICARITVRTAVALGVIPPLYDDERPEDVDAITRMIVAEDLDRAVFDRSFHELDRAEQRAVLEERFAGPLRHLYEYVRTGAMIRAIAAPLDESEILAVAWPRCA